ncbi:MAG: ArsR family transcriptional regulator [Thermoplasmataceae archaeon]|jgi:hypothetical protein
MSWKYAISLYDYETIPLIKIILEKNTKVEMVFLLSTKDRKPGDELVDLSRHFGIKIEVVPIYDINNFYEVYLMLEKICKNYGFPSWINIASGSGIALSALTLHAYFKDAPLVMFDKEKKAVVKTDVNKLKKIKIYKNRYFELISLISEKNQTNSELAHHFQVSVSSMSRRLKHLEQLDIVSRRGLGKVNSPYFYKLTEFGKRLL